MHEFLAIYYVCDSFLFGERKQVKIADTQILAQPSRPLANKAKHFTLLEPVIFYELQSTPEGFYFPALFARLGGGVSVLALTTARKHISSFFTMPHKTPRNILLSYFAPPSRRPALPLLCGPLATGSRCMLAYY